MDEKVISLLEENNRMLKEILSYLRKFDSEEYQSNEDIKQFCINVSANIFIEEFIKNNRDIVEQILRNFKI